MGPKGSVRISISLWFSVNFYHFYFNSFQKVDDEYESAKKAYVQFRQICSCFETEAILKDHQFAQPHFLEFQSNPMKLIFALFDRFDTIGNWNQKQLESEC